MADLEGKIMEETRLFESALPELLQSMPGKWVVFRDGVQSVHESGNDAYAAALAAFGQHGGYVVAQVNEITLAPVSAGALYGIMM